MQPRHWREVVDALTALGCTLLHETEDHVHVIRGAMVIQPVPKLQAVPVWLQRFILANLSFSEAEYVVLLRPN